MGGRRFMMAGLLALAGIATALLLSYAHPPVRRVADKHPSFSGSSVATVGPGGVKAGAERMPIKPADPDLAIADRPVHPHPITPAHERIYRENNLIGALNQAVDLADASRIREVLVEYRAEYPADENDLHEGYAIIADCIDHLDAPTRQRARYFWETEIRSQTRRYVRRHCLSPQLVGVR